MRFTTKVKLQKTLALLQTYIMIFAIIVLGIGLKVYANLNLFKQLLGL